MLENMHSLLVACHSLFSAFHRFVSGSGQPFGSSIVHLARKSAARQFLSQVYSYVQIVICVGGTFAGYECGQGWKIHQT
jgi:hypothetical protein